MYEHTLCDCEISARSFSLPWHIPASVPYVLLQARGRDISYILNTFKVFMLSSVKKTSRLPLASLAAATPNRADPLPD